MEKDLTKFDCIVNKKMANALTAMEVKAVRINGEIIILKTIFKQSNYLREKKIYILLKDEDFLPELKYFDDKHFILGLTDVGDSINLYKVKNPEKYNKLVEKINKEIKNIVNKLFDKYSLYHNDLREKNICIDNHNKIRLIDFEGTSKKLHWFENQYLRRVGERRIGGDGMYFICTKI